MPENSINKDLLPKHVAIIMDGNGRWAKSKGLPRVLGHRAGVERVKTIVRFSSDLGIKVLTLYAFSTENWKRPADEVTKLMGLLVEYLRSQIDELNENNVKLITIGDISALPKSVQNAVHDGIRLTQNNTGMTLAVALNYGSRAEITNAVKRIAANVANGTLTSDAITEQTISDNLYTAGLPDPDLVIRTSGETRISNFLMYQIAYSELYFTDVYWPDFDNEMFLEAISKYQSRSRRFGGV